MLQKTFDKWYWDRGEDLAIYLWYFWSWSLVIVIFTVIWLAPVLSLSHVVTLLLWEGRRVMLGPATNTTTAVVLLSCPSVGWDGPMCPQPGSWVLVVTGVGAMWSYGDTTLNSDVSQYLLRNIHSDETGLSWGSNNDRVSKLLREYVCDP